MIFAFILSYASGTPQDKVEVDPALTKLTIGQRTVVLSNKGDYTDPSSSTKLVKISLRITKAFKCRIHNLNIVKVNSKRNEYFL